MTIFSDQKLGHVSNDFSEKLIGTICWIVEKAKEFQKNTYSCFVDYAKVNKVNLTVWITTSWGIFLKWWEYQTTLPASWETCMQVSKQ